MKDYREIIDLPHPTSPRHPRMSRADRAAQFAPFSALTGYDDVIDETARLTDRAVELTEEARERLDQEQRLLAQVAESRPEITVTYFIKDPRKSGGAYQTLSGRLLRIDAVERIMHLEEGLRIPLDQIIRIHSALSDPEESLQ